MIFILHKKLDGEKEYGYSCVPKQVFKNIPKAAIFKTTEVEDKPRSKEELEELRREVLRDN